MSPQILATVFSPVEVRNSIMALKGDDTQKTTFSFLKAQGRLHEMPHVELKDTKIETCGMNAVIVGRKTFVELEHCEIQRCRGTALEVHSDAVFSCTDVVIENNLLHDVSVFEDASARFTKLKCSSIFLEFGAKVAAVTDCKLQQVVLTHYSNQSVEDVLTESGLFWTPF